MQDTEDLILETFKLLGKTADAKKAEAEAAKAASEAVPPAEAVTPNQPVETEAHEVELDDHAWYSPEHLINHTPTITVAGITALGLIAVAWINSRRKKHK
jgi:hypothetical protein